MWVCDKFAKNRISSNEWYRYINSEKYGILE